MLPLQQAWEPYVLGFRSSDLALYFLYLELQWQAGLGHVHCGISSGCSSALLVPCSPTIPHGCVIVI